MRAQTSVAEIKNRVTLRDAARRVGIELPERDGVKFCSPLRPDKHPSCTIHNERLHDHSLGESWDCIGLVKAVQGCSFLEACDFLNNRPAAIEKPRRWPTLEMGTVADIAALSKLRRIAVHALEYTRERGFLRFADTKNGRAWVLTDSTRTNAQARLLSGETWPHIGGAKAWTLPGSKASHPLGVNDIGSAPFVALVEGGPDFLAAFDMLGHRHPASSFAVVAMLGASQKIPASDIAKFSRKVVRIFCHDDDAGAAAANRWAAQIHPAAARVEIAALSGIAPDLNDLLRIDLETYRAHEELIESLLRRPA